ncbi:FIST signal transduction protein [Algibacter pacificus]|uniref:FIST signal transduction protein n=1 Tax=Algibacter pacificus TaxID=2599389 RepID=UPI0011CBE143|nr:FIST N-terminal domain-containing protein [Algibacter pacificus]
MKVYQLSLSASHWLDALSAITVTPNLFLLFVSPDFVLKADVLSELHQRYPEAIMIGCSTAGEISEITVKDNTIALTAIQFENTRVKLASVQVEASLSSEKAGQIIAEKWYAENLKHVFVLSEGLHVDGAELLAGLKKNLNGVSITGGLALADKNFTKTLVAVGLYGNSLQVGYGSEGGWDSFGIERLVTKSDKKTLYELDVESALAIYKRLLGSNVGDFPGKGLLFPLSMRTNENETPVVRGISGINKNDKSLIFGINIPEGAVRPLIKGSTYKLIKGARDSAVAVTQQLKEEVELAILISCLGRRLILKQLVEEEVEIVQEVVGRDPKITGVYSYGEIAPFGEWSPCELHHQTMTITTLKEC